MNTALTIAGSDSSGGAGIQADLKTMTVLGVFGMSAITALTAQNTMGITAISEVSPEFLKQQLDCILTDIFPDAVKIGMVPCTKLIEVIADKLTEYRAKNIVLDPVMMSTSGSQLINNDAVKVLKTCILPLTKLITPNIPEAEVLTEMSIKNGSDMERAALKLHKSYGCSVLIKGGHSVGNADDLLITPDSKMHWFCMDRINNKNTHGTGCTLSSAIASYLAKGKSVGESVALAKEYISGAIAYGLNLGKGIGPLAHNYRII